MVAFNACFTLLPAFCSLAGVTLGPTSAHAAAVHSPGFQESSVQAPFKVPRSATHEGKHAKRHPRCKDGSLLDVELLNFIEIAIGKAYCKYHHERRSSVIIPGQDGASYYVAASHRPPQIEQRHRKIKGLSARDEDRLAGRVNVLSHDDGSGENKKIASLLVEPGTRNLVASKTAFTQIYLVNVPMDLSSMPDVVALQILGKPDVDPDCVTYGIRDSSSLTVQPCTPKAQTNASQFFEYDKAKGVLRPFSEGAADSKNSTLSDNNAASTESVDLDDRDGTSIEIDNVTLVFVPDSQPASAQEAAVELPSVVTSTTTLITTVTVTSSATPSAAAQDVAPTASSGTTSSTASASPTPSSNEFKVKVVGPESSSGSESSTSEPPATPTTPVNAEEVASRIAAGADKAASATSTDTSATSPTAAALAAAASDETTMASGTQITTSSTTPSSFAPYSSTPTGTPTPAALAAVDMSVSSMADTSSATGTPTSSLTNSLTPTGTPVPAALAAVDNSAPSSSRSTSAPASNDNSSSSTAAPGPMVTPLNVLMESQD